jgi:ketosteroid isomerase-like protein
MDHPNATLVRDMDKAMQAGDLAKLEDDVADDIVWHEIGNPEPKRGKAALREQAPGAAGVDYDIKWEVHDVVANDDHAIALGTATATRGDKTLTYRTAEIYHVKDGKITERWAFSDDTKAITDFFGS